MKPTLPIRRWLHHWLFTGVCGLAIVSSGICRGAEPENHRQLGIEIVPQYHGAPLLFDRLALTNAAGQSVSVGRLDFIASEFALHRADGTWLERTNWQAFVSLREGRTGFHVEQVPEGEFDRIRFYIGLRPALNHADPAQFPASHPLNPNLNGLYWGWAGGYIFFAMEGSWRNGSEAPGGYAFHLGNDPLLMTVELPVTLAMRGDESLKLALDVGHLLLPKLSDETASTHSREGDDTARQLQQRIAQAFTVLDRAPATSLATADIRNAKDTAFRGTPYRFTFGPQFPIPDLPLDNPLTEEGVALGRRLFSEPLLSINNSQSCASCHQPAAAFSDPGQAVSLGAEGKAGTRRAMPLFNLAWKRFFFWDGRASSLREQVLMPIQNPVEMHETLEHVVAKLAATPDYPAAFAQVFGTRDITSDRLARSLEQFLLTQLAYDSKFDRAMTGMEPLTEQEQQGFALFVTEYDPRRGFFGADCFHCHGGPFFTNHRFSNNGLDVTSADPGLKGVTGNSADHGKFSVPSLRNVELTGPYMHDGRFKTLEDVIEHYRSGIKRSDTLDPNISKHPGVGIPLTEADKSALVAFLKTLTNEDLRQKVKISPQPGITASR